MLSESDSRSLQEDLRKLSDWSEKWKIPFNISKCQILQVGSRNRKKEDHEICGVNIKSVHSAKDLGVTVSSFSISATSLLKTTRMMRLIKRNFSFKNKDEQPLHYSF